MINKYLMATYIKGGRGPNELDCWGLVRLARVELFGKSLLPSYSDVDPQDKRRLTEACKQVASAHQLKQCEPTEGAIATAWRGKLCVHVGLVVNADGRQWILETDEASGPCLTPIPTFESNYSKVIYYDD